MTYDRRLVKFDANRLRELRGPVYAAEEKIRQLPVTSEHVPRRWQNRTGPPHGECGGTQDSGQVWETVGAPFQSGADPSSSTGTRWEADAFWIRKAFDLESVPENSWVGAYLAADSGTVFLNGTKIIDFEGHGPEVATITKWTSANTSPRYGPVATSSLQPVPTPSRGRGSTPGSQPARANGHAQSLRRPSGRMSLRRLLLNSSACFVKRSTTSGCFLATFLDSLGSW